MVMVPSSMLLAAAEKRLAIERAGYRESRRLEGTGTGSETSVMTGEEKKKKRPRAE
jgi:hypothetical protein